MHILRAKRNAILIISVWFIAFPNYAALISPGSGDVAALIAAVTTANSNNQSDTIDLGGFTFTLTAAIGNNGLPLIGADNAHTLLIRNGTIERSAAGATPQFRLIELGSGANVSLDGVTLRNGSRTSAGDDGGAVLVNDAVLTLVNNSVFENNSAADSGGAIAVAADGEIATIRNSTFSGNNANSGGALALLADSSAGTITGSTFNDNSATLNGGAISFLGALGNTTIGTVSNSTFSGNSATNSGGALSLNEVAVENLSNLTIAGNSAGAGGGIFLSALTQLANLNSNIIAQNTLGGVGIGPDLANTGIITAFANNLIGTDGGHTITNGNGNQVGTNATPLDPLIAPLADNGGPTETRALLATSPAIDAGINPLSLTTDQRGSGYLRLRGAATDIGAFEIQDCTVIGDSDADGACNDADNCSTDANADQANDDSDAVGNTCDNCVAVPNNDQADVDSDGVGDACDTCQDTDQDGFGDPDTDTSACPEADEEDNCPLIANPEQDDEDEDGLGNKCDTIPVGAVEVPVPPPPPILPPPLVGPPVDVAAPIAPDLDGVEKAPSPDVVVSRSGHGNDLGDESEVNAFEDASEFDVEDGSGCSLVNGANGSFVPFLLMILCALKIRRIRYRK